MTRRYRSGRFRPDLRPAESAPILHDGDELARAGRVLAAAAMATRKAERSAYVRAHVAALLADIEARAR